MLSTYLNKSYLLSELGSIADTPLGTQVQPCRRKPAGCVPLSGAVGTAVGLIDSTKSSAVPLPKRSQFGANSCDSARQRAANFFGTHEFARHCLFLATRRTFNGLLVGAQADQLPP